MIKKKNKKQSLFRLRNKIFFIDEQWTWIDEHEQLHSKILISSPENVQLWSQIIIVSSVFHPLNRRRKGGKFWFKKKLNSFYRNGRLSKNAISWNEIFFFLNTQLSKNGGGVATFRSTSCERWKDRTRHIPAWRSTSVGRWIAKPRWNLRSRQSISFLEEQ